MSLIRRLNTLPSPILSTARSAYVSVIPKLIWRSPQTVILSMTETVIAGALSGAISNLLLYPWERIKLQMQVTHEDQTHSVSISQAFKNIKQRQGFKGFYKGLKPFILGNAISYAIYFFVYEKIKKYFTNQTLMTVVLCSAIAGVITTVFVNFFWMLQTRMALSKDDRPLTQVVSEIFKKQGISSIWKGLSSSLILVSNPIIQFCLYEWLKKALVTGPNSGDLSKFKTDILIFLIAAISKAIATILTYPYTIIRTFQHLKPPGKTMVEIVREMIEKQGISCMFRGITPKLIQTVLNAALMMTIYQRITSLLRALITGNTS